MVRLITNYNDVYSELSYHVWKSALEIRDLIAEKKKIRHSNVGIGGIYSHLNNMYENRLVDKRDRELTPKQLENRGRRSKQEYKLTTEGLRKQLETRQETNQRLEGILNPAIS